MLFSVFAKIRKESPISAKNRYFCIQWGLFRMIRSFEIRLPPLPKPIRSRSGAGRREDRRDRREDGTPASPEEPNRSKPLPHDRMRRRRRCGIERIDRDDLDDLDD